MGTEMSFGAYDVDKELAKVDALRINLWRPVGRAGRKRLKAGIKSINMSSRPHG